MQTDVLGAKCCSLSKAWKPLICQSVSGECSAAGRENKTNEMLEIIRKGRDKTKSLKSGLTEGKEKRRDVICCVSTVNRAAGGRAGGCLRFTLPGAGAGKRQEMHFHAIIINQWKSLPRDVMAAKSVKGVQKGIIQINGRVPSEVIK